MSASASIPLNHLPLQRSTLTTLQQCGFVTVGDLENLVDNDGGNSNGSNMERLVKRLKVSSTAEAIDIFQQVQSCLVIPTPIATITSSSSSATSSNGDNDGDDNDNFNSNNNSSSSTTTAAHGIDGDVGIGKTAKELLQQHSYSSKYKNSSIITFCREIDQLLGSGGISLGQVVEVFGMPGSGKTQLAIQLCVNTCIPINLGGVNGSVLYIDSEGNFNPSRCHTMAKYLIEHLSSVVLRKNRQKFQTYRLQQQQSQQQRQSQTNTATSVSVPPYPQLSSLPDDFTPEHILSRIHVYRVHNEKEQEDTIMNSLESFIQRQQQGVRHAIPPLPPVKLIIIDSMAFHYRSGPSTSKSDSSPFSNSNKKKKKNNKYYYLERSQKLTTMAAKLGEIATKYDIAVVAINHMTTKFIPTSSSTTGNSSNDTFASNLVYGSNNNNSNDFTSTYVPALGESWAHATHTRLQLLASTTTKKRVCKLIKSPDRPSGTALFQILEQGIRDIDIENATTTSHSSKNRKQSDRWSSTNNSHHNHQSHHRHHHQNQLSQRQLQQSQNYHLQQSNHLQGHQKQQQQEEDFRRQQTDPFARGAMPNENADPMTMIMSEANIATGGRRPPPLLDAMTTTDQSKRARMH